jgi:hypothetical protein
MWIIWYFVVDCNMGIGLLPIVILVSYWVYTGEIHTIDNNKSS